METDAVRQLSDGEELVLVRHTSPSPLAPAAADPRNSLVNRLTAVPTRSESDWFPRPSWPPSPSRKKTT